MRRLSRFLGSGGGETLWLLLRGVDWEEMWRGEVWVRRENERVGQVGNPRV